ncbi:MAG TPA: lytic transglycosylase domain-containing protein, partial [Croceibacterium sp.]|nr:lytic transglycosylase domain-containing protein [Croceibacterium sp.]
MKFGGAAFVAALLLAGTAQAQAESTREYFVARMAHKAAPAQLSEADRTFYRNLFNAIDGQDWTEVQTMLAQRPDGLLTPIATAEFYTAANSPKVSLDQINAWLVKGRNLPEAAQLGRLALARGATAMPDLPVEQPFYPRSSDPRRLRPPSVNDGTMPDNVRQAILDRITNDDPDGARLLLDGVDAVLSSAARAEWRYRVAWSYYITNRDPQALAIAQTVSDGTGAWVAEGYWTAGLAAWRLGDCTTAGASFEQSGAQAQNLELRSAAYYWASRAALRCRHPERSEDLLRYAASASTTLYGMLA